MEQQQTQPQQGQEPHDDDDGHEKANSGFFRFKGIIGFLALMTVIILVFVVFAGRIIKVGIEEGGSHYWGAQIDVAKVDVTWSPFKLSVQGLEATDPQNPTHNSFAFDNANVSMDLMQAILGKTIVHELVVTDVNLNQPRKSPGKVTAVFPPAGEGAEESVIDQTVQSLPSVDDLMARSQLKTVQAGLKLKQTYEQEKVLIDQLRKDLPTKAQLKEYEAAVKRITDAKAQTPEQVKQLTDDFNLLKKKFEKDKEVLSRAQKQLTESGKKVGAAVVELKNAPEQDMQMIAEKYQFDENGAQNFTKLIFGPQAAEYIALAQEYYQKVKPLLDKMNENKTDKVAQPTPADGRFIHFAEAVPMPDWLVEKAKISMSLDQGQFDIEINELNSQHWKRKQATTVSVNSQNLLSTGALKLNGQFFVAEQGEATADANWNIAGLTLANISVSESEKLKLSLSEGSLKLDGKVQYADSKFTNSNQIELNNTQFAGSADDKISSMVVDVLSEIKNLSIDVGTSGYAEQQDMDVSSDLDSIIMDAMKKRFKVEVAKLQDKAKVKLKQKVAEQMQLNQADSDALKALDGDFSDMQKQLESLLKNKLEDKLKDSLKDKLLNKLSDFF